MGMSGSQPVVGRIIRVHHCPRPAATTGDQHTDCQPDHITPADVDAYAYAHRNPDTFPNTDYHTDRVTKSTSLLQKQQPERRGSAAGLADVNGGQSSGFSTLPRGRPR